MKARSYMLFINIFRNITSSFIITTMDNTETPVQHPETRQLKYDGDLFYVKLQDNQLMCHISDSKSHLFKAIRYYCANYYGDNVLNKQNKFTLKQKFTNRTRTLKTAPMLPIGITEYYFMDICFVIQVRNNGQPLATDGWTGYYEDLIVCIKENEKTYEENYDIFDAFIKAASKYMGEKWLDQEDEDQKVTVYIWDDYWETLEKSCSRKLSTIYLDGKEKEVYDKIVDFKSTETMQLYRNFGIPYKYNILLHGVPGSGKTSLIFSLASELKMNIAILSFTSEMTDTILMRCFRRLPENCILIIEDIDALFESRKKNDDLKNNITFSGLLNITDGIAHVDKQIIMMTTNHPLVLDQALKRPGRVDLTIEFTYATKSQIKNMFEIFLPKQTERFTEFYTSVKHLKLTTAILQHFLFSNRLEDNIMDCVQELEKLSNENDYDGSKALYS